MHRKFGPIVAILLLYSLAAAELPIYFDPLDFEPEKMDPLRENVVAKFVYISFRDHPDTLLTTAETDTIPQEFSAFFEDQSRGQFHVNCSVITDPRQGREDFQWIGEHLLSEYRAGTVDDFEDYRSASWAEVTAETIFKIYETYEALTLDNPFEDCDFIFVVHEDVVWDPDSFAGVAGTYLTAAIPDSVLPSRRGFTTYHGFGPQTQRTIFEHEFGHLIGAVHAPSDNTLNYGIYDPMRPVLHYGDGFYAMHHKDLTGIGWTDNVVVSEEEVGLTLHELQGGQGQPVKVMLQPFGGLYADEALYLSLHTGAGYESHYPSRGVAVWHSASSPSFLDPEQARGRYANPDNQIGPDPVSGLDLMDYRWEEPPEWLDGWIYWYDGHPSDFFPVAEDSITEFSYRTNPSTSGGEFKQRLADQNVPSTLTFLMTATSDSTVNVDILKAPREQILSPADSVFVPKESTFTVTWDDYFNCNGSPWDILDEVQLWFTMNQGTSYEPVAAAPYDSFTISWTPGERYATENGGFKLIFTNTLTDAVGEIEFEHPVVIEGTPIPWESVLQPNGGEDLVAGCETDVKWTNYWDGDITRVDLLLSVDSGQNWIAVADSIDYDAVEDVNVYSWTPPDSAVSDQARVKLLFYSAGGAADDTSSEDFLVFPLRAKFTDATNTGLPQHPYGGIPASVVPIAVENDTSGVDILVSIGSGSGNPEGKLFVNGSIFHGYLDFDDESATYLPDNLLEVGFGALVVGDYDGGGEDFFACRPDDETSELFRYDEDHFESANGAFAAPDSVLLTYATCASWIDYDHDGDLDFYIGRADGSSAEPDALFEFDQGEFEDIAPDIDLSGGGLDVATSCIAWTDLDGDGMWELARGSSGSSGAVQLFTQVSADSFAVVQNGIPGEVSAGNVQAVHWADFDRDNDFDLLIMLLGEESYVCENVDGSLVDVTALPTADASAREGIPLDFDLDGWTDILVPNDFGNNQPLLFANFRGLGGTFPDFKDMAEYAGIGAGVDQFNVLAADLNRDGDQDLFLGRDAAGAGTLYNNVQPDSTETPASHWVGFRLVSGTEDNDSAIGTTITLATVRGDDPLGVQIIDGGSGRGSQSPRQPIFGLGDFDEPVGVAVHWPAGRTMEFTVDESEFGQIVTVVETDSLHIDDSSVAYQTVDYPGDLIDWVFTWETDFWSNRELDQVEIQHRSGSSCANLDDGTLNFGDQNISCSVTYQVDPQNGDVSFKHELRWLSQECYPNCSYKYKVHSSNGTISDISPTGTTWKTSNHKFCPHSN